MASATGGARSGTIDIHITTDQGAVLDIPVNVNIIALTPQLTANPSFLNTGMVVGTQTSLSFQVTNIGGAPSGDLQVLLPTASFLSLASSPVISSLAPGASSTVTLELDPASSTPLGPYSGTIVLNSEDASLTMPFTFRAITTAVGDVQVLVDDDYTFTVAGSPHVSGATVSLLDPFDNSQVIATGTTDSTGQVTLTNVPAGPYVLQVQAAGHASYQASYTVVPGITNTDEVFISNQLVTYSWQVTPASVADQYTVQLQTTFQTDVPAPVVTISAPAELPTLQPGQTGQFNLTLTNHGLIAAQGASVTLPTDLEYTFSGLSTAVGNTPADTSVTVTVGNIPANTSVTVPVTVVRNASDPPPGTSGSVTGSSGSSAESASDPSDPPPCTLDIPAVYFFVCAGVPHELTAATTVHVPGRVCNDAAGIIAGLAEILANIPPIPPPPTITLNPTPGPSPFNPTSPPNNEPSIIIPGISTITPINCNPVVDAVAATAVKVLFDLSPVTRVVNPLITVNNTFNAVAAGDYTHPVNWMGAAFGANDLSNASEFAQQKGLLPERAAGSIEVLSPLYTIVSDLVVSLKEDNINIPGVTPFFSPDENPPPGGDPPAGGDAAIQSALSTVESDTVRVETILDAYAYLFSSNDWLASTESDTAGQWIGQFLYDTGDTPDESIDAADQAQLLATTLPDTVTPADAIEFIDRWNRTIAYAEQGITTASQVPAGQSTDFLDQAALTNLFTAANNAILASQADGYSNPVAELQAAINQFINTANDNSVCATVQLQLDQTATLTRSAFSGTLSITNSEGTGAMTNVVMDINITDADGNPANGEFFVSSPTYGGQFSVVNGNATLPDFSTGTIAFTFIPDDSAAPSAPTIYNIGGTIGFTDPSGGAVTIPVFPSTITVDPQAQLQLNYFLQQTVIGDDPSTPQVVIPSEPAVLGLLVTNVGGGTANDLSITTAQPQIIQNEKGLADTFQIIGTQVGTQQVTPSLTVDLGNVEPGQTADADFLLESSLDGELEDFSATFTHTDALGGLETSLISSVQTHSLVHAGDFNYADSTGEMDYLVNDIPNPENLPDTIYFSDGTTAPVNVATNATSSPVGASGQLTFQVTANVTSGWDYIQIPDPGAGYTLYKVVRSDGTVIPVSDQAWTTDRTISSTGQSTVDYELHILDDNSTGSYMVYYRPTTVAPPAVASITSSHQPAKRPRLVGRTSRSPNPSTPRRSRPRI